MTPSLHTHHHEHDDGYIHRHHEYTMTRLSSLHHLTHITPTTDSRPTDLHPIPRHHGFMRQRPFASSHPPSHIEPPRQSTCDLTPHPASPIPHHHLIRRDSRMIGGDCLRSHGTTAHPTSGSRLIRSSAPFSGRRDATAHPGKNGGMRRTYSGAPLPSIEHRPWG